MQDYICTCTFLKLARRTRKSTYLGISTPYRWADKITTTGRISKIQLSTFRKWRMLEKCSCRHSAAADPVKMFACMIYKSSVSRTLVDGIVWGTVVCKPRPRHAACGTAGQA